MQRQVECDMRVRGVYQQRTSKVLARHQQDYSKTAAARLRFKEHYATNRKLSLNKFHEQFKEHYATRRTPREECNERDGIGK